MRRKSHVRFLGGGETAMSPRYPTGVVAGLVSHHGSIGTCDSSWHAPPCHPAGSSGDTILNSEELSMVSPELHLLRLMGLQPIHDQEDLPGRLAEQSLQERDEQGGRHGLLVGHEVDRSLVADRRDHVHPDVWVGYVDPRRLPLSGVAPSRLLVGRRAGLVAPVDLRTLAGCPPLDRRIGLLQPLADLLGVLILGMTTRHLDRVAPPPEVLADGPHWHVDPKLFADQVGDGPAGPQRRGDPYLLGALLVKDRPEPRRLAVDEGATGANRAAGAFAGEGFHAVLGVGGPPPRDGLPGEAKQFRHLDLGEAQLAAAKGP